MHLRQYISCLLVLLLCEQAIAAVSSASADSAVLVRRYSLEECREMALQSNTQQQISEEMKQAATLQRKAALAAMFPKLSLNAAYLYNSKKMHLIGDEDEFDFGTVYRAEDGSWKFKYAEGSRLKEILDYKTITGDKPLEGLADATGELIANGYGELYDRLTLDMTHIVIGAATLVQPIYVGGRLRELYHLAQSTERIAGIQADNRHDETIVAVDEAYWRVISVEAKCTLAGEYLALLNQLEQDVTTLVENGLATKSDLLKVKAKRGDAEMKMLQASNGLILSKMALCQVCGLPLDTDIALEDNALSQAPLTINSKSVEDIDGSVHQRSEIQLLEEAEKMAKSGIRLAAASLQPNIMATANYIYTNPNAENGLSNEWQGRGFFSAGVVLNIPIANADAILRYKAAKHEARLASLHLQEAKEKITLQITQANQKCLEAQQRLAAAELGVKNAEEVLRFAQESFAAGMTTATDLLQAEIAWQSALSDRIDAAVEVQVTQIYFRKFTSNLR